MLCISWLIFAWQGNKKEIRWKYTLLWFLLINGILIFQTTLKFCTLRKFNIFLMFNICLEQLEQVFLPGVICTDAMPKWVTTSQCCNAVNIGSTGQLLFTFTPAEGDSSDERCINHSCYAVRKYFYSRVHHIFIHMLLSSSGEHYSVF